MDMTPDPSLTPGSSKPDVSPEMESELSTDHSDHQETPEVPGSDYLPDSEPGKYDILDPDQLSSDVPPPPLDELAENPSGLAEPNDVTAEAPSTIAEEVAVPTATATVIATAIEPVDEFSSSTYGHYDSEEDYKSGHEEGRSDYTDGMTDEEFQDEDPHARFANAYGHDTVYHEEPYVEDDPNYHDPVEEDYSDHDHYHDYENNINLPVANGGNGNGNGDGGEPPETDFLDPMEMDPDDHAYNQGEVVKPFLDHLEDLRWTLVKVVVTLVIAMVTCLVAGDDLLLILKRPLTHSGLKIDLMAQGPLVGMVIALKVAFFGGLIISAPFLFYFIAEFVMPALKPKEKKYLGIAFLIGSGLFLSGVSFCYFLVLEISLKALAGYSQWLGFEGEIWLADEYMGFVLKFMFGMGISFEMPVVILTLVKLEVIDYKLLERSRRHMVVICLIVAAILTPPDALSMVLLGAPLYGLFEICIWIAKYWDYADRKRAAKNAGAS
jgi:sec-independent protein translocase protein TatC